MPRKLEITGLSKWFGELEALRGIDIAVEQGEFISVVGPSGCGKTTFLRMPVRRRRCFSVLSGIYHAVDL